MLESQRNKLEELISDGYSFPISDYINEGWRIYKMKPIRFIAFMFLFIIISIVVSLIPLVGQIANSIILGPALFAGLYIVAHKLRKNEYSGFDNFFLGFEHLAQLAAAALTIILISLVVFSPSIYLLYNSGLIEWWTEIMANPMNPPDPEDLEEVLDFFSGTTLLYICLNLIPYIYLAVAFSWANFFIIFYDLKFWDAIESSRRLITRNWFSVFLLYLALGFLFGLTFTFATIILAMIPILGVLLIFLMMIAMFCLIPVIYTSSYAAFADVTKPLENEDGDEDIIEHLIE